MSRHVARSVMWLTLSEIVFNVAGYVIHSAVGRILGPEDYGRYGIIVTLTTMIVVLVGNGIPSAMSKYISEIFDTHSEQVRAIRNTALRLQVILMTGVTVLFFLCAPITAWLLGDATLTPLLQLSSLIIPAFAAASFYFSYFTGLHQFEVQAFLKTLRSLARVVLIISLAYVFGVTGTVVGYIIAPLIVFSAALYADKVFFKNKPWNKTSQIEKNFSQKKLLRFAWPMTLFMLFYEFLISIDLFLVKKLLTDDYLTGIYNASITLSRVPYFLFYALAIVLFPMLSKASSQNNIEAMQGIVSRVIRLQIFLLAPIAALMIAYAQPLITLFYGQQYGDAVAPFQFLVIGSVFLTLVYIMSYAFSGVGRVKIPMIISAIGLIAITTLGILTIQLWGLQGAALSTTLVCAVLALVTMVVSTRVFDIVFPWKALMASVGISTALYILARVLPHDSLAFLFLGPILFVAFFMILSVTNILTKEDIQPFRALFASSKNNMQNMS